MASSGSEAGPGAAAAAIPVASGTTARRPLMGLTTYMQQGAWGVWDTEAVILPAEYVHMVVAAGGVPVLLPPHGTDASVLDGLDGLVLTGGADVGPERYGAVPHERTQAQPWRDDHEFTLLAAARERGMPVLGICRGLQVINAALGGTLHQHVPEVVGHSDCQPEPGVYGEVTARVEPGSRLARAVGEQVSAPCYHHQSVAEVGAGLVVTARAEDGTVEALETASPSAGESGTSESAAGEPAAGEAGGSDSAEPWLLAVQWHPEHNVQDVRVVTAAVDAARVYAEQRARAARPPGPQTVPAVSSWAEPPGRPARTAPQPARTAPNPQTHSRQEGGAT
ncbi:gamma-glutamyl-gamma-aminobutyrate hydrolase family protein [Brevibacterium album]|uniref:gamma-glutamyl-gamma-aminobutyrate hydrolase family protein n=1 Tax=Brevibacterium album TaxID=417948 RepID=UPI0003FD407D|nr:gamma-glutamyl-gamma-aminobutyrate hydrolase family protein [Brevibacterium album]